MLSLPSNLLLHLPFYTAKISDIIRLSYYTQSTFSGMSFINLQHLLKETASQNGNGQIICYPLGNTKEPTFYSYYQLKQEAQLASWALRVKAGSRLSPGAPVMLHFDSHWDNIFWFWAVILAGCVPVMSTALPASSSLRTAHLDHLSRTLMNPLCLTRANLLPEFSEQESISPFVVESLDQQTVTHMEDSMRSAPSDTAVMMLTSGSTGRSKAVCLSHGQIFACLAGKLSVVPLSGKSFMNWIRLDHVAALIEIHLQAMFARKDQVHVHGTDVLSRPTEFIVLVDRHRVTRTFAPNFFLAKLRVALHSKANGTSHKWDLSCLKYVASGGEANVIKTCDEVSKLLVPYGAPPNVIVPGFGMTETCAGSIFNTTCPLYDIERKLEFASVGVCMPGIEMRITDDSNTNTRVTSGKTGNLEVKGPAVFGEYFNDPKATADSFSSDGWFKTGDRGFIDKKTGYLTLAGRRKETMIINGVKYSPYEIESVLNESKIPGITPNFNCCFSSFPAGGETEVICLVYLPTYAAEDTVARVQTTDAISKIIMMATGSRPELIPLDESLMYKSALGKLSRDRIKASYEKGEFRAYQESNRELVKAYRRANWSPSKDEFEHSILTTFIDTLGLCEEEFDVQTPVFDVGITSMELIRLKRNLEGHLDMVHEIPMITLMATSTVRELSNVLRERRAARRVYSPLVTLQSDGSKTPLWLVHPGAGEVLVFLNLAKFIKDRPVHALRARGFNDGETPFSTIDEAVSTYYATVKEKQPHGPYALAGYCYGAMLAFEVSKRLEQNGDTVAFLGAFNLPPHIKLRMRHLDYRECLLHLAYFLDLMTESRSRELADELKGQSNREVFDAVMRHSNAARLAELAFSRPDLEKWACLACDLHTMAADYDPVGSVGCMDVFFCTPLAIAAASKREWREEHLDKWRDFSRSEPLFHDVPGRHYTMLLPENVFEFQKILRRALEARGI